MYRNLRQRLDYRVHQVWIIERRAISGLGSGDGQEARAERLRQFG
jgi:hypothetical protein